MSPVPGDRQADLAPYRDAFAEAPLGMALLDQDRRLDMINRRLAELLGYANGDLLGRPLEEIVHPEERESVRQALMGLSEHSGGTWTREVRLVHRAGVVIWVILSVALPDPGAAGERHLIVQCQDISELRAAVQRQKDYLLDLEATLEERTREAAEAKERLQATVGELESKNREVAMLNYMGNLLQACETEAESYPILASICRQLFPADSGYLAIIAPDRKGMEVVSRWGGEAGPNFEFDFSQCWAIRRGIIHAVHDPELDPVCRHVTTPPEHGCLCAPISAQSEVFGILHLAHGEPPSEGANGEERMEINRQLVRALAERFAPSLASLRLRERLQSLSISDPLTGLFNRRYMEESLRRAVRQAQREQEPVGVIIFDVDRFKSFNDTFGHEVGDLILKDLGQFLRKRTRRNDLACRFGGEEFVLVLPGADLDTSTERAENLVRGIREDLRMTAHGKTHRITVSAGVACYPNHGPNPDDLINAADSALYEAKDRGRDQVVRAD